MQFVARPSQTQKMKMRQKPPTLREKPPATGRRSSANIALAFSATLALLLPVLPAAAAEPIPLRAGPVTMSFDADNVFLRYIRVGQHEVLRGINAPIRPHDWSTVAPEVSNLEVDDGGDHFRVTFDVRCAQADVDFRWKGTITGTAQGVVEFGFDGEAHSAFKRNRIGFCVLHGPSAAGQPWVIETADGKSSEGKFPQSISPHQPAKNLRAVTHEVAAGIRARVAFEGEVFEMEDQRNWTDASFKTYCTPLEIPYPVQLAKGAKVSQKIRISLEGDLPKATKSGIGGAVLTMGEKEFELPRLGLQISGEIEEMTKLQVERLKALNLDHLRVDLALSDESFSKELRRATQQAKALGVSLQIGLNLGESPDFETLLGQLKKLQPPVSHWLVSGGDPAHFRMAREQLKPVAGEAKIGVTRITNFVDLNRSRPEDKTIEAVGFAINPQIHAFDNASMVETLAIHADAVKTTREFMGGRPLVIGPVTLSPQFINGEDPPGGPPAGPFPTYVDPRQSTDFAAAWTLGSIKYLADAGAHSATFYETVGWTGIMDADDGSARPANYPSKPGKLFPVYHLLQDIGEFAGGTVRSIDSSDPLAAEAIALRRGDRLRVLVANLSGKPQTVTLRGLGGTPESSVELKPYGIARIDRALD
jgi:D-apionolactonase